jgi:hypothetical protein
VMKTVWIPCLGFATMTAMMMLYLADAEKRSTFHWTP